MKQKKAGIRDAGKNFLRDVKQLQIDTTTFIRTA